MLFRKTALLLLLSYSLPLAAAPLLEYALHIDSSDSHLDINGQRLSTRVRSLGINWSEALAPGIAGSLQAGRLEMTQSGNPQASAVYTNGAYAGIALNIHIIENKRFLWDLSASYHLFETNGVTASQQTRFTWEQRYLGSTLLYTPMKKTGIFLGVDYYYLAGEQRDSGTTTTITTLSNSDTTGYRIGIQLASPPHGLISLAWLDGYRQGIQLRFRRIF